MDEYMLSYLFETLTHFIWESQNRVIDKEGVQSKICLLDRISGSFALKLAIAVVNQYL